MSYRLGLVGFPLEHSLSPRLHAAALQACGLEGSYERYPVPTEPEPEARAVISGLLQDLRVGRLHGLNVTIPHKQTIYHLLDNITSSALTAEAGKIGAVNTLWIENGRLMGGNTDAKGFQNDLARLGWERPRAGADTALVLGAGGAARAVVYALAAADWRVCILARRQEQAQALAASQAREKPEITVRPYTPASFLEPYGLVVNTTPLGLPPNEQFSPWPAGIPLPADACVYDLVYQQETPLLKAARADGNPTADGLGMLIEQAALSFQIWTGCTVPIDVLHKAVARIEDR